ncbi:MAG: BT_3928 family protein [Bacteroidota bacterium]
MKILKEISRFIVGGLFIFSGLIKLNDPVGTSIKLHEYFDVFASDIAGFFKVFVPYSLPIAVFLVVLEVILGIAVLLKYRMNLTSWILLILILFFTFLTFYSAYFNKVTDCGCFGDAIKLTPWQSFTKDVILVVFIGILFFYRKTFKPVLYQKTANIIVGSLTVISIYIAIHAINHLPFIDFRTYKVGNHIPTLMKPSGELITEYTVEKDGKQEKFTEYPSDPAYKYISSEELNPEVKPKITDYSIYNDEGEFTDASFKGNKLYIVVYDAKKASRQISKINALIKQLESYNIDIAAITASTYDDFENYRHETQLAIPYYYADATVLKTIIRANPGIVLMQNGAVLGKWHNNDTPDVTEVLKRIK